MSKLALNLETGFLERNRKVFCTTVYVAERFEKEHRNVIRDIETKIFGVASKEFTELNFELSSYKDGSGKKNKQYEMTRDGFFLAAMGFTGRKAMRFKEEFICLFDRMEEIVRTRQEMIEDFHPLTDAIKATHTNPQPYHYSNVFDMINKSAIGTTAKVFRETHGLPKGTSIRGNLPIEQSLLIRDSQRLVTGLLVAGQSFDQCKAIVNAYCANARSLPTELI